MNTIWIRQAHTLVTRAGDEPLHRVDLLLRDGVVQAIGEDLSEQAPEDADRIDASACVVYPGFVNTHHHFPQVLTRNLPAVQDAKLFDWLTGLYEVWRELSREGVRVSAQVAMAELLLSGCTTTTDHFYLFPSTAPPELLDVEIEAAAELGMRFHPMRGSMSLGRSEGGLPPDDVVQRTDEILADCERVIERWHDPDPLSLCRVVLAPCSPFSVTTDLLKETAKLARAKGVRLHTHLAETEDENADCLERLGMRPLAYMEACGWVGDDVWFAHGIHFNDEELKLLADTGTGIAHCPASNLRLGSGICRVPAMMERGIPVGLGVDGSSSNDSGNFLREMQLALLVHRVGTAVDAMPARRVLELATLGGARVLGQPELGKLEVGGPADLAMFRLDLVDFAGAMHDPAAAPIFCGPGARAEATIVAGEILVRHGVLTRLDEERLVRRTNEISEEMVLRAEEGTGRSYRTRP